MYLPNRLNIVILPYISKLHIHGTNFHFWDLLVCFISWLCLSLLICCHVRISLTLIPPICILDENVASSRLSGKFIKMVIEEMNPYASWQMKNFNVSTTDISNFSAFVFPKMFFRTDTKDSPTVFSFSVFEFVKFGSFNNFLIYGLSKTAAFILS